MKTRKGSSRGSKARPTARRSGSSRRAPAARGRAKGTRGNVVRVVIEQPRAAPTVNARGRMVEAVIPKKAKF